MANVRCVRCGHSFPAPSVEEQAAFGALNPTELGRAVARAYGTSWEEVLSRKRSRFLVIVRAEIARRLRARGLTFAHIGIILGRDHTSVINLIRGRGRRPRGPRLEAPGLASPMGPVVSPEREVALIDAEAAGAGL